MSAYVIKSWKASPAQADASGRYVEIVGRAGGLLSWALAQLTIDPTVSFVVLENKILFERGSMAGSTKRVIPMSKISSSFYGYTKPWREALIIGFVCGMLTFWMLFLGALAGVLYYVLNKTLTIGVVEDSGVESSIAFKQSVIEGQKIDEAQARVVCEIIEAKLARQQTVRPSLVPPLSAD